MGADWRLVWAARRGLVATLALMCGLRQAFDGHTTPRGTRLMRGGGVPGVVGAGRVSHPIRWGGLRRSTGPSGSRSRLSGTCAPPKGCVVQSLAQVLSSLPFTDQCRLPLRLGSRPPLHPRTACGPAPTSQALNGEKIGGLSTPGPTGHPSSLVIVLGHIRWHFHHCSHMFKTTGNTEFPKAAEKCDRMPQRPTFLQILARGVNRSRYAE